MCGIAGLYFMNGCPAEAPAMATDMIRTLQHRGPDGFGYYNDKHVALAHARLSIIDLVTGDQPVHNEDETVWVVLNGEIFNYIELRSELEQAGHRFYTRSDTEVIVHLYEEYGERFPEHLNGQFAIALWDAKRQRLLLSRDRTGIRPLYYTTCNGALAFGSEIKSIFALPAVRRSLNLRSVGEIFTFWSVLPPATPFDGILTLPPGCTMIVDHEGHRIDRYWDWAFPEHIHGQSLQIDDLAGRLRELLIDAVRLQLRADVPVGAYLSGGLDSATIAVLIRRYTDTPLRTFSVEFEDAEYDESRFQRQMVQHLGAEHTRVIARKADIARAFPRLLRHTESPVLRTAPAPLMILAEHVHAQKFKVVLTGEGADEVFGGYDIFKEAKIRRFWAREPRSERRPELFTRLYSYLRHSPTAGGVFSRQFFGRGLDNPCDPGFAHGARWRSTQRLWQFLSDDARDAAGSADATAAISRILPDGFDRFLPIGRDQYVEAHTLLSGYLLSSQGDRVAMAHSVEGRFPFLDHRVIEFASGLHPETKVRGLTEKFILKKAVRDLLPADVVDRVKQPYRAPDSLSFVGGQKMPEYVAELLSEPVIRSRGYFKPAAVTRLVRKCADGRSIGFADNMAFVGILSTMLVDHLFVRGLEIG